MRRTRSAFAITCLSRVCGMPSTTAKRPPAAWPGMWPWRTRCSTTITPRPRGTPIMRIPRNDPDRRDRWAGPVRVITSCLRAVRVTDPLLARTSSTADAYYALMVGSPALNAATDGTNIGAYQGAPVPEPATLSLLALGGMAVMNRRRNRRRAAWGRQRTRHTRMSWLEPRMFRGSRAVLMCLVLVPVISQAVFADHIYTIGDTWQASVDWSSGRRGAT